MAPIVYLLATAVVLRAVVLGSPEVRYLLLHLLVSV
jgi:hypothetical protein